MAYAHVWFISIISQLILFFINFEISTGKNEKLNLHYS